MVVTYPITIQEPFSKPDEYPSARDRAVTRAIQDAIAEVIGVSLQSSRENQVSMHNEIADQKFSQIERSDIFGLARPKVLEESIDPSSGGSILKVRAEVTVCAPKQEFLDQLAKARALKNRKVPTAVDPSITEWFDPKTGQPRLWYSQPKGRSAEFFDAEGFHPKTGTKLQPVTGKFYDEWKGRREQEKREALQREERAKKAQAEREERERKAAEFRAEQERQRAAEQLVRQQRLERAHELCDQYAASPYDARRPAGISGAPYDILKTNQRDAVEACEAAVQRFPNEQRFRYQYARALQISDPKKAIPLLRQLMALKYPAAFDNYGWALLDKRVELNDANGAVASFRMGADLGDPDAMDSLASFILEGKASPRSPDEALTLLQRAASTGHVSAQVRLQAAREQEAQMQAARVREEQQRIQQEQAARMFLGIVGGALQSIPRR
jgi:TPR repeat protein